MRITIIRNIKSIDKLATIVIGLIKEDKPNINNMLKVLDPNIFPRAMSFSPFLVATRSNKFWKRSTYCYNCKAN